jgi:ferritin
MASKKMEKAINKHLNAEMYSAYLYASMAAQFEHQDLQGFAGWMKAQAAEEMMHAQKFYAYINDVGGRVVFDAIEKPPADFGKPLEVFKQVLAHEKLVTAGINKLVDLAREESDHATENFLQWFVKEQVEEESVASHIVARLDLVADAPQGLFMMDTELGRRAAPAAGAPSAS